MADLDPDLLRYLTEQRVQLGDRISVVSRQPFGGPIVLRIGQPPDDDLHCFGTAIADAVSIKVDS